MKQFKWVFKLGDEFLKLPTLNLSYNENIKNGKKVQKEK